MKYKKEIFNMLENHIVRNRHTALLLVLEHCVSEVYRFIVKMPEGALHALVRAAADPMMGEHLLAIPSPGFAFAQTKLKKKKINKNHSKIHKITI